MNLYRPLACFLKSSRIPPSSLVTKLSFKYRIWLRVYCVIKILLQLRDECCGHQLPVLLLFTRYFAVWISCCAMWKMKKNVSLSWEREVSEIKLQGFWRQYDWRQSWKSWVVCFWGRELALGQRCFAVVVVLDTWTISSLIIIFILWVLLDLLY